MDFLNNPPDLRISLDSLLEESMQQKNEADQVKASRQLLAKGGLPTADREAIEKAVRAFEMKREWLPQAYVVMFNRQRCKGCGGFHTQFAGFFQRQQHRDNASSQRWIPFHYPTDEKLPRESKYNDSEAMLCQDCAEHLGFEVEED